MEVRHGFPSWEKNDDPGCLLRCSFPTGRGKGAPRCWFPAPNGSICPTPVPPGGQGPPQPLEAAPKLGKVAPKWGEGKAQRALQSTAAIVRFLPSSELCLLIDTLSIYPTTQVMHHRPTPSFPPKKEKGGSLHLKARGIPPSLGS
uniref:Uncharacterized protein n=1 Tax=Sphaerodactylus townsendi TaxID=933632 RepID=A0ACB8E6D3_9SAUR